MILCRYPPLTNNHVCLTTPCCTPRQSALGSHVEQFKNNIFAGGTVPGASGPGQHGLGNHEDKKKEPKVQPMSRRISKCIGQCSSKITEVLSWQSKLQENKPGLNLECSTFNINLVFDLQLGPFSGAMTNRPLRPIPC